MARFATVAALLALSGCQVIAGLTERSTARQSCLHNSDCAPTNVCLFETCSVACVKDVDCAAGARCLNTTEGAACVTSAIATCPSQMCPTGTTCSAGVCRTDCTSGDPRSCTADQTCSSRLVCVGTDSSHDPGTNGAGGLAASGGGAGTSSRSGAGAGGSPGQGGGTSAGGTGAHDLCVGVVCNQPPASDCNDPKTFKSYDKIGSCAAGKCSYAEHLVACTCQNSKCTTDPCIGVTCASPPAASCRDEGTVTQYEEMGTCTAGTCSYTPTDKPCDANQQCGGTGVCSVCKADASCGGSCTPCGGGTPKCKDLGTTSKCVACLSNAECGGSTPACNTTTNVCGPPPSCVGLAATCGPSGNASCCASNLVTGGTFNRSNDANYPATVSNFRLDNYEITVGRLRKFVAAYSQTMIAAGAGKNPNNPSDTGWNTAWNANLDATGALADALKCSATYYQTWTDAPGTAATESLPITCLDWFEAEAFCIWDGGRLPTEAEWNYASAGGTAQRAYPWGATAPDCTYANFYGAVGGTDYCVSPGMGAVNRVGSESPKGDGPFGQSDLAGNVYEWVQDLHASPYANPCNDCANLTGMYHVVRGGSFYHGGSNLLSSDRGDTAYSELNHYPFFGARCARSL